MYLSKGEKNISIQFVKDCFVEKKIASKKEIAEITNLSIATVTNILKELQEIHYIERIDDCPSTGGRKAKQYRLCGESVTFGLISLQVINQEVKVLRQVVDLNYNALNKEVYSVKELGLQNILDMIEGMETQYHIKYLGISIPAISNDGVISQSDIAQLDGCRLKEEIENILDIQVVIENDVNSAMLGYIYDHSINQESIAFVYQPDNRYSGCSLYINKAIVYGANHFAGELGYLPYVSLSQQEKLLKNNPLELLVKQVASIIAIVNPSHMIIYSICVNKNELLNEMKLLIPTKHLPVFEFIDSMDEWTFKGLMQQCIEISRYKTRRD